MDDGIGAQISNHANSGFWQINIGHVLQIITMLSALAVFGANMISGLTTQNNAIVELKETVGDMHTWRDQQDARDNMRQTEINQNFDAINRHLERLDWMISPHGEEPQEPAAQVRHRPKE